MSQTDLRKCYERLIDVTWKLKDLQVTLTLSKMQKLQKKLIEQTVPNDVVDRLETQTSAVNKLSLIKDLYELKYETSRLEQAANERTDFMESVIMPRLMTRIEQIEMADQEMDKKIKKLPTPFTKIKLPQKHDGTLTWAIINAELRIHQARVGVEEYIDSPIFYTNSYGYKMKLRFYINGNDEGYGTHLSIYLVILKGDYDALLDWPFKQKVTLTLVSPDDPSKSICKTFSPDTESISFKKPTTEENPPSGIPCFAPRHVLDMPCCFVKRYTMCLHCAVDNDHYKP